jgi:predicted phosphodiesterase
MEIKKVDFPGDLELYVLGDVHYGDNQCDKVLFHKIVRDIKNKDEKNTAVIITGDLLNVGIADSVTGAYGSMTLGEELDAVCTALEPIKHMIIGFVSSNHHSRVEKKTGMSIDKEVAVRLGINYLGHMGLINITVGSGSFKNSYFVAMHHGAGGGRTQGAKANELMRLEDVIPGCDVYVQGHTHTFQHLLSQTYYVDRKRSKVSELSSHYVTTGHFLGYENSYAAEMKLRPSKKGVAVVKLSAPVGNKINKEVTVRLQQ